MQTTSSPTLSPTELADFVAELKSTEAANAIRKLGSTGLPLPELWSKVSKVLPKSAPFSIHLKIFERVYRDWDQTKLGPPPAWLPDSKTIESSNLKEMMKALKLSNFEELHRWSVADRARFWDWITKRCDVRFKKAPSKLVDISRGVEKPQWFPGATMNIADSCFTAPKDKIALIHQKEGGPLQKTTYEELDKLSNRIANGLIEHGFKPGDVIGIAMAMNLDAIAAYLGIVKAGCAIASIADSFTPNEIQMRLRIGNAKGMITQDFTQRGGKKLPMYEKVCAANAPQTIVIPCEGEVGVKLREGDLAWKDFVSKKDSFTSHPCSPDAVINVLFSSGTTGEPKAITWNQSTPLKCVMDYWAHHDTHPEDVLAWPTNLGWVMGPIMIFCSMVNKSTYAVFDGIPTTAAFGKFVQDAGVTNLGLVPSLVKAWRTNECMTQFDWSKIRCFCSSGESSNPEDTLYLMMLAGYKPMLEYCGGTEIGGGYIMGTMLHPYSPSMFTTPALGHEMVILDENNQPATIGEAFVIGPAIGLSTTLLNRDHHEVYYADTPPGPNGELLRRHGDQIEKLPGGFYRVHGRVDDTMNLGGIKTSSAEIETAVKPVEGIIETAAIAVPPPGGGPSLLVIYAVLRSKDKTDVDDLKQKMQAAIKNNLNPLFKLHQVIVIDSLPRTATGKVMRRVLRDEYLKSQKSLSPVTA